MKRKAGKTARISRRKLCWDSKRMIFTNSDKATAFVKEPFRKGWGV